MGLTWTLLLSLTPLTPDKMRVLLALTLLVFVTGALAGGKEKQEMMMWMKMKAMEGCLGQEVVMDHMKKMKISAAKCMKVDTPELELPMFTNTYRFANSLARRPRLGQGSGFKNVMETFMKMQMFSQMVEMYGNMTCMLRECNVLDSENKFYPEGIKMEFEQMKIKDQWLKSELEKYCDQCIELAEAVPQSMLDDCPWGGEMVKTKFFMKCMMKKKICMHYDIKTKIEAQFGPMKDLVQETMIPEKQLYMIVKQMLKGPEEMMMMMS